MIKDIQGIIYDANDPGKAFGGGIYSVSCNIGFANAPTKITLNIVSEDAEYTITDDDMKVISGNDHKITIGGVRPWTAPGAPIADPVGGVTFNRMYLYSYSFSNTAGSKTLTVHFVDQSICMDKIFVGLIGRHGTKTKEDASVDDIYNPDDKIQVKAVSLKFGFRLMCLRCNELRPTKDLTPPPWEQPHEVIRQAYVAGDGDPCGDTGPLNTFCKVEQDVPCVNGGYILLGQEQFKETECEIPKVEYTFRDICNALDWILGADPQGCNGAPSYRHNLRDFNRSDTYQASYTGTLREVLSAWAADYSFDFTFSYETDELWVQAIDLKKAIDLTDVKQAVETGFGPSSERGLIRSHRELHTLENTYYQTPLVKYIKPPRPFQRSKTHYEDMRGRVLTPYETIGETAHLGRTDDELYVSMALATYNDQARLIWLSDLADTKHRDLGWCNPLHDIAQPYPGCGPGGAIDLAFDPYVHGHCYKNVGPPPFKVEQQPQFASMADCCKENQGTWDAVAGTCNGAGLVAPAGMVGGTINWVPNANDPRLRRDSPWPALGFFPSISFNKRFNTALVIDANSPVTDWNPRFLGANATGTRVIGPPDCAKVPPTADNPNCIPQLDAGWVGPGKQTVVVGGVNVDYPKRDPGKCAPSTRFAKSMCHKDNELAFNHYFWREQIVTDYKLIDKNPHIYLDPMKYSVYLGIWNENYQNKVGDFDKELANSFLGQYAYWWGNRTSVEELEMDPPIYNYGPINPPPNQRQCPKFTIALEGEQEHAAYLYQHKITTLPESKIYSGNSYPFDSLLRVNGGFFAIPPGVIDTEPYCSYCPNRSIFRIEDNAWGTPKEEVNKMFRNRYTIDDTSVKNVAFMKDPNIMSDLNIYVPYYLHIDPEAQMKYFVTAIGLSNWRKSIIKPEMMKSGYFPGLAVIPHMEDMNVPIKWTKPDGTVVTEDKPVLTVNYDHWRCTANQVLGAAPCPPDDDDKDTFPADPDDTNYNCANHWCFTGNHDGTNIAPDGTVIPPGPTCIGDDGMGNVTCTFEEGQWRYDAEVFNALVFRNHDRRRQESQNITPSDCTLYCEEDIAQEVCACPDQVEPVHGFEDYRSRVLTVGHIDMSVPIVYPVEHDYTGFWVSEQMEKGNTMRKQVVMGEPPLPKELKDANVMGTRVLDLDATNDLDVLEVQGQGNFQEQIVVTNTHLNPPQDEVVSLPQYYSFVQGTTQSADSPGESVDLKIDGTEFDDLTPYLTPKYGLNTFNIVLDGEGLSTDVSFRSRPAKLPKRDVLLQKIGPRALEGRIPKPMKIGHMGRAPMHVAGGSMEQDGGNLA